jgi:hypothetical protein
VDIDDKTKITFSVVVIIVGVSAWMSSIFVTASGNKEAIAELKRINYVELHNINVKIDEMHKSLHYIKGKLDQKKDD